MLRENQPKELAPRLRSRVVDVIEGPANSLPRALVILSISCAAAALALGLAVVMHYWGLDAALVAAALPVPILALIGIFSRPANPVLVLALGAATPALAMATTLALDDFTIALTPTWQTGTPQIDQPLLATLTISLGNPNAWEWGGLVILSLVCVLALYISPKFAQRSSRTTDRV
jgi:hypothetical protein